MVADRSARSARSGGLRERKEQETRKALRQAALRLVLARGLEHVLVEDIARAAHVGGMLRSLRPGAK